VREDQQTSGPDDRRWLPGFEEPASYAERRYARDSGFRASRRASGWTAAALVAAVAATTGYLAHSIPSSTTSTTTGGSPSGKGTPVPARKSTAVQPGAPGVSGPVVTSGGSGVAAGSAAGGRGGDN
jgi:hypothetical protein